jgi:hypothetical protein
MSGSDFTAAYRLHAAHCLDLAHRASDSENRLLFLAMARAWLKLAEQAIKNSETVLVYETPVQRSVTSAFGGKADIANSPLSCPLLTQSGHWLTDGPPALHHGGNPRRHGFGSRPGAPL